MTWARGSGCTGAASWSSLSVTSFPQSGLLREAQSCRTLCNPMDYTVHGILQARILEWAAFPFSRGSSQPRDQAQVAHISGRFFTSWATRKAPGFPKCQKNLTSERGRKCGVKERKTAPLLTTFRLMAAAVESSWGKWAVYLTLCLQQKHLPITCGFSRTWEHMWTISGDHFYYQ